MNVNQVPRSVKGCVHRCLGGACQCSTGIEWVFGNFGQREEHDSVRFPVRQPLGECTFGNPFSRLPAIVHDVSKMADQAWDLAGVIPCERSLAWRNNRPCTEASRPTRAVPAGRVVF